MTTAALLLIAFILTGIGYEISKISDAIKNNSKDK